MKIIKTKMNIYFPSPAVKGYEGKPAPFQPGGIYTFYNMGTGLCEIRSLKPLKGKVVYHGANEEYVHFLIVSVWDAEDAQMLRVNGKELQDVYIFLISFKER